ncbi:MAG: hypothetical protein ACRD5M_05105 [Candidatus Acidiferrales bacterium]
MTSDTSDFQRLAERVLMLEKQNRRLKWGGVSVLAALSMVVLMGQAVPPPRIVEAQKFVLKDKDGKVRGWMGVMATGSELMLGNNSAQPMMRFLVSTDSSNFHFYGVRKGGMTLAVDSGDPSLSIVGADGSGGAGIAFGEDGPSLTLQDAKGFSTVAGATQLKARAGGEGQRTTAASVVLLGKNKKILWRAP